MSRKHLIQSPDPSGMYVLFTTYPTYIEINLFPWCMPQSILVVKTLLIHSLLFPPKTIISIPTIKHTNTKIPKSTNAALFHQKPVQVTNSQVPGIEILCIDTNKKHEARLTHRGQNQFPRQKDSEMAESKF